MDLQRKNFKRGGAGGGSGPNNSPGTTQSGGNANTSTNQGPAGGASAGGNYGGNVNPNQTYAGTKYSNQTYAGGNNNVGPKAPPSKPKPTKKNTIKKNPFESYFNYHPVVSTLNKISKSKFATNQNAKRREKYLNDLLETDPDEYNRVMGDLAKVNMIVGPQVIGSTQLGPQVKTDYGMPSAPPGMLTSNFEEIDGRKSLGDPAALEILGQKYKDTLPTFDGGGGGGGQTILPYPYNVQQPEEEVEEEVGYDYRLGTGGDAADVTRASYVFNKGGRAGKAEGGIMGTRARRAMGGIMSRVDQRQGYFLGGIGKAIKGVVGGVVDATKKVLKSDFGKAALLAGGAYYLGGGNMGSFGNKFLPTMRYGNSAGSGFGLGNILKNVGSLAGAGIDKYKSMGKFGRMATMGGIGLGLSMIPGLNTPKVDQMPGGGGRGGGLKNSQGGEGQQAIRDEIYEAYESGDQDRIMQLQKFYGYKLPSLDAVQDMSLPSSLPYPNYAEGGRIGKAEGGLMDLGGMEKDYRAEGGFVPIGEYEKKDDVPARLSVNEFVFTADAVRGAGQGDIDKGAEIMENMMENLENGGTISEESQGKNGAQQMFETSQRLGEVV